MWLGGKIFPDEKRLRWANRWEPEPVRIEKKITISGKVLVYGQAQTGGKEIILKGWLTPEEYNNLRALHREAGQYYTLIFDSGEVFPNVVIMNIDPRAVLDRTAPNFIDVTITLLTVAS